MTKICDDLASAVLVLVVTASEAVIVKGKGKIPGAVTYSSKRSTEITLF